MQIMKVLGFLLLSIYLSLWSIRVDASEDQLTRHELDMISELVNTPSVAKLNEEVLSLSQDIYLLDAFNAETALSLRVKKEDLKAASLQLINALELDGADKPILLELGRLSREIKSINSRLSTQKKELLDYHNELRVKSRLLVVQNDHLRKKKISLRDAIVSRLRSSSNDEESISYQGNFICSPLKNIKQCLGMAGRKADVIAQASASLGSVWTIKDISHYKITNASMDLDGNVNYKANIKFKRTFSDSMFAYVNDLLELSQFSVRLYSNQTVEYFIDGKSYGLGREKTLTLDVGIHSFYIKNQNGSASIVRRINSDGEFFIPLSVGSSVKKSRLSPPKSLIKSPRGRKVLSHGFSISGINFNVPVSNGIDSEDVYSDQGNLLKRLSFNESVDFCKNQGMRLASQLEYTKILKSSEFQNQVGLKSSYWLNEGVVLARMGDGILAKRVKSIDKYSVLCVK